MTTCSDPSVEAECSAAGLNVQIWHAAHDGMLVVQIDQEEHRGKLRVNINDGAIWSGDPEDGNTLYAGFAPFDSQVALSHIDDIGIDVANHVLEFFGHGGYAPGSNRTHVLNALVTADPSTFRALSTAFPDYAAAVVLARNYDHGIEILLKRAERA